MPLNKNCGEAEASPPLSALIIYSVLAHEFANMAARGLRTVPQGKFLKLSTHNPSNWRVVADEGYSSVVLFHNLGFSTEGGARIKTSVEV